LLFAVWMLFIESNPWPKLTLIVSLEAIFLSTFVMIGRNRQAAFQEAKADHEFTEQKPELKTNTELTRAIHVLTTELHRRLIEESSQQRSGCNSSGGGMIGLDLVRGEHADFQATAHLINCIVSAIASWHRHIVRQHGRDRLSHFSCRGGIEDRENFDVSSELIRLIRVEILLSNRTRCPVREPPLQTLPDDFCRRPMIALAFRSRKPLLGVGAGVGVGALSAKITRAGKHKVRSRTPFFTNHESHAIAGFCSV
jgi:hypothetical protein